MDYFRPYRHSTGTYKQHNQALKWFRHKQELRDDPFASPPKRFDSIVREDVATVEHGLRTSFAFDEERMVKWDWKALGKHNAKGERTQPQDKLKYTHTFSLLLLRLYCCCYCYCYYCCYYLLLLLPLVCYCY